MGRYNIDDILDKLGEDDTQPDQPPRLLPRTEPDARHEPHTIDRAEHAFSPLPAAPANQKRVHEDDPAVKESRAQAPTPRVGQAVSELYLPDDNNDEEQTRQVGEVLVDRGAISREQLTAARQIVRQSSGQDLVEVLITQGGDESAIQRAVAELAGVRERVIKKKHTKKKG